MGALRSLSRCIDVSGAERTLVFLDSLYRHNEEIVYVAGFQVATLSKT